MTKISFIRFDLESRLPNEVNLAFMLESSPIIFTLSVSPYFTEFVMYEDWVNYENGYDPFNITELIPKYFADSFLTNMTDKSLSWYERDFGFATDRLYTFSELIGSELCELLHHPNFYEVYHLLSSNIQRFYTYYQK